MGVGGGAWDKKTSHICCYVHTFGGGRGREGEGPGNLTHLLIF